MKDHNNHDNKNIEVTEHYKEEGAVTLETLEVAAHDAHSHGHAKQHANKGFTLTTPLAIIIASVIIAGGLMGYGAIVQGGSSSKAAVAMFKGKAIDGADYIEGKENSKVIVVEYSDPECPFCVQLSPTIEKVRSEYAGKIAFVYRHFPLTQIHKNAFDESRAIACAGKIGGTTKYYEYIDTLYKYKMSKQTATLPSTGKEDFAKSVGLDMTAFGTCMKENQTAQAITDSTNDGVTAGVQGTPSTFILVKTKKGYEQVAMIDGARQMEFFKAAIDEALAR